MCPNEVLKVSARMTADLFIGDVVKIVLLMIRRINGPVSDCMDVFKLLWPFLWISINSVFLSPYLFFPLRGKGSLSELVDETQHKYRLVIIRGCTTADIQLKETRDNLKSRRNEKCTTGREDQQLRNRIEL